MKVVVTEYQLRSPAARLRAQVMTAAPIKRRGRSDNISGRKKSSLAWFERRWLFAAPPQRRSGHMAEAIPTACEGEPTLLSCWGYANTRWSERAHFC